MITSDAELPESPLRILLQKSLIKSNILYWVIQDWMCVIFRVPLGILSERVHDIFQELLKMKQNLYLRWVPRLRTVNWNDIKRRVPKTVAVVSTELSSLVRHREWNRYATTRLRPKNNPNDAFAAGKAKFFLKLSRNK